MGAGEGGGGGGGTVGGYGETTITIREIRLYSGFLLQPGIDLIYFRKCLSVEYNCANSPRRKYANLNRP